MTRKNIKPTNNNAKPASEAEQVKAALDDAKDSIKKTIESEKAENKPAEVKKELNEKATVKSSQQTNDTAKTNRQTNKPSENVAKQPAKETTNQSDKSKLQASDKTTHQKTVNNKAVDTKVTDKNAKQPVKPESAKPTEKRPVKQSVTKPKQIIKKAPPEKKKSGGLGVALALLLGLAGTGLGAYSFNELRLLKGNLGDGSTNFSEKLSTLENKVGSLGKNDDVAELKKQLAALSGQEEKSRASEKAFNARIAKIEQMQSGLSQAVKADVEKALDSRMKAVDNLLGKVKEIELSQKGLSKNLTEASAVGSVVSADGMSKQEVGYLLRMANYKIQSESDIHGATGLLKMAESKLLANNDGEATPLVESIREKLIQLSGVKAVDENALLAQLKTVSENIAKLSVKVTKSANTATTSASDTKSEPAKKQSLLDKVTSIVASGVKYTPKDPSKIDISSETVLIEKRLLQADVKTAELAVRSHDKVLLASSIQSIKSGMNKYFVVDEIANSITKALDALEKSELDTVLPNLSGLVSQFENNQ